jgi:TRAP-type C4-dicarboxylate transport system permease small subunit
VNAPQPRSIPRAIDRAVYHFERWLAGSLFLAMSLVMFASVLLRTFLRPESKLVELLCWLARLTRLTDIQASEVGGNKPLIIQIVVTFLLCYAGVRTMKPLARWGTLSRPVAAGVAAALTGGLALFVYALLRLFPNGIADWAPPFALSAMLWAGFLGASIATYERRHLALEMGEKIWPKAILRYIQALAFICAAAMCAFLLWIAYRSLSGHYAAWKVNPLTGNLGSTHFPQWIVFLIFPYTFLVMGIRFLAQAGASALGKLPQAPAADALPIAPPSEEKAS